VSLGSKLTPPRGSQLYTELYQEKFKRHLLLNRLMLFDQTQQEWSLGGLLPKLFKWFWLVAYVGHGVKKIGLQKAIFKNLLLWNYKAQSFYIWYITLSRGPLPKLFKLCPWGQNWHSPGGHSFTLNYMRKTSNDFLSWTANGNLTKLNSKGPWVVLYQNCSNGSSWLHK